MEDESFPALEQNPDRSFSPASIDNLLMSEHLLNTHSVEDLDCPMIFPHPPCLPPPALAMHAHQSGSLSPRALAQSTMSGQSLSEDGEMIILLLSVQRSTPSTSSTRTV